MNDFNDLDIESGYAGTTMQKFTLQTFLWMGVGLLLTTITAFFMVATGLALEILFMNGYMHLVLIVAQLGVVVAFSSRLFKASITSTRIMFAVYSILTGVTFSVLGYLFNTDTIAIAFGVTVVYFGALVVIGFTTKMNLMRLAPILMVGLIVLIIFNVLAMFINLSAMTMMMSSIGLILFTGLTAYDTQKMKKLYIQYQGDEEMLPRLSMYSAFELYLDFINIFLYILRLLGNKK